MPVNSVKVLLYIRVHAQEELTKLSRMGGGGHQVRRHPYKLGIFAIFYHAKKPPKYLPNLLFSQK